MPGTRPPRFSSEAEQSMSAWLRTHFAQRGGRGVTIAVIDSGWHAEWADPLVGPGISVRGAEADRDFVYCDGADDAIGHGSRCTLLLREIASDSRVLPIKIFDGRLMARSRTLCSAIKVAVERGADVINLSLSTRSRTAAIELYEACQFAARAGRIVVAAADRSMGGFPSTFDNVIGVSGGLLPARLGYGISPVPTLDFAANAAVELTLPPPRPRREIVVGSSMAAPVLSGICALLKEVNASTTTREAAAWLSAYTPFPSDLSGETAMGAPGQH